MDCPECKNKMVMLPEVLLSNPPKYQYYCDKCKITKVVDEKHTNTDSVFNRHWKQGDEVMLRYEQEYREVISVHLLTNELSVVGIIGNVRMIDVLLVRNYKS